MSSARRVLAAVLGCVAGAAADTYFCQFLCRPGGYESNCFEARCPSPGAQCEFFASQAFADHAVCSQYLASSPLCDGGTHQCAEAANFQLVWDRLNDLRRTYEVEDWTGVEMMFGLDSVLFSPGGTAFHFGREGAGEAIRAFRNRSHVERVDSTVHKVLTVGSGTNSSLHSLGSWAPEPQHDAKAYPYYLRWIVDRYGHWVADTAIVAAPTSSDLLAAKPRALGEDPLFDAIAERQAEFTRLYNAKNYSQLVGSLYADTAAIIGVDGTLVPKAGANDFFGKAPLGSGAKLSPKIVTRSPREASVAHEVGFSDSTKAGYYARWIQRVGGTKEWVMESHVFSIFPPVSAEAAPAPIAVLV